MYSAERHRLKDCRIAQSDLSGHNGVYLTLHLDGKPRNTIRRLNTSMLNDPAFKESIKTELNVYLENNDNGEVSPATLWDAAEAVIRGKISRKRFKARTHSLLLPAPLSDKVTMWVDIQVNFCLSTYISHLCHCSYLI